MKFSTKHPRARGLAWAGLASDSQLRKRAAKARAGLKAFLDRKLHRQSARTFGAFMGKGQTFLYTRGYGPDTHRVEDFVS